MGTLITEFDTNEERSDDIPITAGTPVTFMLVGDLDKGAKAYIEWKRADGSYDIFCTLDASERGTVVDADGTFAVRKMASRSNLGVEQG